MLSTFEMFDKDVRKSQSTCVIFYVLKSIFNVIYICKRIALVGVIISTNRTEEVRISPGCKVISWHCCCVNFSYVNKSLKKYFEEVLCAVLEAIYLYCTKRAKTNLKITEGAYMCKCLVYFVSR
jgi:hypothetical protein